MTTKKTLSKQEEIALLEQLAEGGGYFAEFFKQDVGKMAYNIKNDFPIELTYGRG